MYKVYCIDENGGYNGFTRFDDVTKDLFDYAVKKSFEYPEIKVIDSMDCIILHFKDGSLIYPKLGKG